jgi:molybdopterin molybdotransferase
MTDELITIAEARERVLDAIRTLASETVRVEDARGRVLAEDLAAAGDVPPFASSAMDGYAVTHGPAGRTFTLVGESRAGTPSDHTLKPGEAIRISTGGTVPSGATAVARQEDVTRAGDTITVAVELAPGTNIRDSGEDMRAGTRVLPAGTVMASAEIAAAVAAGAGRLAVARRPAVAVLATGDELRAPGEPLGPGQIHNSNGVMLTALADHAGARTQPPGRLPDDFAATETGLAAALEQADVVIVSGGVSVGPHDHVKPALNRLGVRERFWGVALQPGKPTWFGIKDQSLVFGLPGNPVSAAVTFSLFAAPALAVLQGAEPPRPPAPHAALASDVRGNPNREQAIRVRLHHDGDGRACVTPNGPQGSHIVSSLVGADALALIPPGSAPLAAGTRVDLAHLAK